MNYKDERQEETEQINRRPERSPMPSALRLSLESKDDFDNNPNALCIPCAWGTSSRTRRFGRTTMPRIHCYGIRYGVRSDSTRPRKPRLSNPKTGKIRYVGRDVRTKTYRLKSWDGNGTRAHAKAVPR